MKSYEQRAREILEARDRILGERRKKRIVVQRCLAGGFGVCAAFLICFNIMKKPDIMKPYPNDNVHNTTVTAAVEISSTVPEPTVPTVSTASPVMTHGTASVTVRYTSAEETQTTAKAVKNPDIPYVSAIPHSSRTTAVSSVSYKTSTAASAETATFKTTAATAKNTAQTASVTKAHAPATTPPQDIPPQPERTTKVPDAEPAIPTVTTEVSGEPSVTMPILPEPTEPPQELVDPSWDEKPFDKKYPMGELYDGTLYYSTYLLVPEDCIEALWGEVKLTGYASYGMVTEYVNMYYILDVKPYDAAAVKAPDGSGYYLYTCEYADKYVLTEILKRFINN